MQKVKIGSKLVGRMTKLSALLECSEHLIKSLIYIESLGANVHIILKKYLVFLF